MSSRAGIVRAEGVVTAATAGTSMIQIQVQDPVSGQFVPNQITVANLIAGGTDTPLLNLGASGTQGTLNIFPPTAASGKLQFTAANNAGNTTTQIVNASFGQASTLTIPDPGNATASFVLTKGNQTISGNNTFSGTTIIDTLSVGLNGTAGIATIFPATASNGTFVLQALNNVNNFASTLTNAAIGQATVYTLPDPGAATANIVLDTGNQTIAGNKTLSGTTEITTLNVGLSGTVGNFTLFPATAASGTLAILAANNAGNTLTTITNASQAGARTYTIPDAGASASFVMTAGTQTIAGVKTFSSIPIGTQYVVQVNLATITGLAGAVTAIHSAAFAGTVTAISAAVNAAFATSNITITPSVYHSGTPTAITNGAVTITQSGSAVGTTGTSTPSAANTFVVGDMISATITGGTGTCGGIITLLVTRTA